MITQSHVFPGIVFKTITKILWQAILISLIEFARKILLFLSSCYLLQIGPFRITNDPGPLLLFLDQALSSHEMLEVQGFQAGTHAGGL